jgi:hypothetical protein
VVVVVIAVVIVRLDSIWNMLLAVAHDKVTVVVALVPDRVVCAAVVKVAVAIVLVSILIGVVSVYSCVRGHLGCGGCFDGRYL